MWGDDTHPDEERTPFDEREYPETTCSECGAPCLDPAGGVGISLGGEPICSDCANKHL